MTRTLDQWKEDALFSWKPAILFNATVAETGEPFLFCSCDFGQKRRESGAFNRTNTPEPWSFYDALAGSDIDITTAARISATFPLVTPPAYIAPMHGKHLVDGGYYDNTGVFGLVYFLRDALAHAINISRVLIIRIEAFPRKEEPETPWSRFVFRLFQPAATMLHSRNVIENASADRAVDDLIAEYSGRIDIVQARFYPESADEAVLSWAIPPRAWGELLGEWKRLSDVRADERISGGNRREIYKVLFFSRVERMFLQADGRADLQSQLGEAYAVGAGVTKNAQMARKWFIDAAKNGDEQTRGTACKNIASLKDGIDLPPVCTGGHQAP
jgi:hypothetical protein